MTNQIIYLEGDATLMGVAYSDEPNIIVHCCNDIRRWGSGFVLALSKRWKSPEDYYLNHMKMKLGETDILQVENNVWVANIIGQHGVKGDDARIPPVRYEAIRYGFKCVAVWAAANLGERVNIILPRIACGLAGGDWALVEPLINATFLKAENVAKVCVVDFPGGTHYDSREKR